ncbi:MAG: PQQ-binding-like beta-propeller repeat protein [Candidatus Omnitrophica bacterium]|nr:PQQ-binding-like beta-propeller repeat protein [Candidatus Omnitrophota bacterium]
MKKRKIIFILLLFTAASGFAFLHFYRINPFKSEENDGLYTYSFNKKFSLNDMLVFKTKSEIEFIELHFSNNRVMRYKHPEHDNNLHSLSRWKDVAGRTRVLPVVRIQSFFNGEGTINLGKDYYRYAGTINRNTAIEKIVSNVSFDTVFLTNFAINKQTGQTFSFLGKTGEFPLRKIDTPATIEDSHVQIWERVCPSPDGNFFAVSSYDGYVYFLDSKDGRRLWHYHVPDGKLTSIVISENGKYVFAGEQSADGNFYCLNADTGKLVWKYSTSSDLGSISDSLPVSGMWTGMVKPNVRDVITRGDTVYIRSRRTRIIEVDGQRQKVKIGRIYAFDHKTGSLKWAYPKDGKMEGYRSSTLHVSVDGKYASWVIFDWDKEVNPRVFVFDAKTGAMLWQYQCDTVAKYFKTSTAYSGAIFSPDAKFVSVALNDGRLVIFDNKKSLKDGRGVVHNIISLTTPIEAGTVPVMTYMTRSVFTRDNQLIVLTGHTYTTPFASTKQPPLYHPNSTSIFCLNVDGELLWRFTAGSNPSSFDLKYDQDNEYLLVSFAHNVRSQDINEHGFYVFDLTKEGGSFSKIKAFYHTDGICVDAQLAPDLNKIFAIEAVIDMDDTQGVDYRGKHRVSFFGVKHD